MIVLGIILTIIGLFVHRGLVFAGLALVLLGLALQA